MLFPTSFLMLVRIYSGFAPFLLMNVFTEKMYEEEKTSYVSSNFRITCLEVVLSAFIHVRRRRFLPAPSSTLLFNCTFEMFEIIRVMILHKGLTHTRHTSLQIETTLEAVLKQVYGLDVRLMKVRSSNVRRGAVIKHMTANSHSLSCRSDGFISCHYFSITLERHAFCVLFFEIFLFTVLVQGRRFHLSAYDVSLMSYCVIFCPFDLRRGHKWNWIK